MHFLNINQRAYKEGFRDGVLTVVELISGRPVPGHDPYIGPMPRELSVYLAEISYQNRK